MLRKIITLLLVLSMLVSPAYGWLGVSLPYGAINLTSYSGGGGPAFAKNFSGGVLYSATPNSATYWLDNSVASLTQIIGAAAGSEAAGANQALANSHITAIQIWGWRDLNGDGEVTIADGVPNRAGETTTMWTKLSEITPVSAVGDAVAWLTPYPAMGDLGDVLQVSEGGTAIPLGIGESWILMIRVVATTGDTNLMDSAGGTEQWENGDTSDGVGSDLMSDTFVTYAGHTPTTSDGRLPAISLSWVLRPKN